MESIENIQQVNAQAKIAEVQAKTAKELAKGIRKAANDPANAFRSTFEYSDARPCCSYEVERDRTSRKKNRMAMHKKRRYRIKVEQRKQQHHSSTNARITKRLSYIQLQRKVLFEIGETLTRIFI